MNSRNCVLTTLNQKEPDRVPRLLTFTFEFANKLRKFFGIENGLFNLHGRWNSNLKLKLVITFCLPARAALIHIIRAWKKITLMNRELAERLLNL